MQKQLYTAEDIFGKRTVMEEALSGVTSSEALHQQFCELDAENQMKYIGFLTGERGIPIQFDAVFKQIFDPEIHPERLENLVSTVYGEKIKIKRVLPNTGIQLIDHGTFVIMDVIAELVDGSFINVEMQKIGYCFPAQRTSCYLSDMIMRQYNRVRAEKGKHFNYSDIQKTYMFIIIAKSDPIFWSVPDRYIHRKMETYDSGIMLPETEKVVYVTLDTFLTNTHNISNKAEAWLTFLSKDDAESVVELVNKYPEFLELYREIREFRKRPEEVLGMWSEALYILDKNTERFMVDELKEQVAMKDRELAAKDEELASKDETISRQVLDLAEKDARIAELEANLSAKSKSPE